MLKVNDKLRLLRESRQWSQEELANKLGMSTKGYAKIERGETRSNIPRLEQISEIFDMDICELLAYGEQSKLSFNNSDNNFSNLNNFSLAIGSDESLAHEVQKYQLQINHKDEIIAFKDEIIQSQKREIQLLKDLIEQLKNKT